MKAVVQRVLRAEVRVGEEVVGRGGPGMLVLLGVMKADGNEQARLLAERVARFRFFADPADPRGRMGSSILDTGGDAVVVSQVTLAADGRKGRRPSLDAAAPPARAEALYLEFARLLAELGVPTATGAFAASMQIELINDGPVTFVLEEPPPARGPESGPG